MGFLDSCCAALLLVAAASASLQPPVPPGYAKDVQPIVEYNLPYVPRAPLWRRAVEIQRPNDQPHYEHSMLQIDFPPPQPVSQQQHQQLMTARPDDQPHYEHSMLLIDHPPPQPVSQQQHQQLMTASTNDMPDAQRQQYERSTLLVDQSPPDVGQQEQHQEDGASAEPLPPDSPAAADSSQRVLRLADQQPSNQEAAPAPAQMAPSQVPQGGPAVYQIQQVPGPYPQWNGQPLRMPDVTILQQPRPFGMPMQPDGPLFRSGEPFPALSPPPVYTSEGAAPWGGRPVPISAYPEFVREQQEGERVASGVGARPVPYPDEWNMVRKDDSAPVGLQRQMDGPLGNFGVRPYGVDRMGPVPYPMYGRMASPVPYGVPFPMERTGVSDAQLGERDQPQEEETKGEDQEEDYHKHEEESSEDGVKQLKDAVDVEEEVVPALVVFLRKKGHKALHDKDSVGIPGKEDRFRRSPGGGSGSSSHSSSSSSSYSSPVYFGDGGSFSSSSSQSSSSSGAGGGAPLGFGASGPGLGGSFHGGGSVPGSGYGATGYGGVGGGGQGGIGGGNFGGGQGGVGGGYGGSSGVGGGYGGGSGVGGGGYGATGYGPGYGSSGHGGYGGGSDGCATCGDDSNVLLNRAGEVGVGLGPFTVGGSGVSTGKGVHSSSSSSIDSTGKVTYSAFAGKH